MVYVVAGCTGVPGGVPGVAGPGSVQETRATRVETSAYTGSSNAVRTGQARAGTGH